MKNAFVLLAKQRFIHAAAFFLLAGSLKDAIEVICFLILGYSPTEQTTIEAIHTKHLQVFSSPTLVFLETKDNNFLFKSGPFEGKRLKSLIVNFV